MRSNITFVRHRYLSVLYNSSAIGGDYVPLLQSLIFPLDQPSGLHWSLRGPFVVAVVVPSYKAFVLMSYLKLVLRVEHCFNILQIDPGQRLTLSSRAIFRLILQSAMRAGKTIYLFLFIYLLKVLKGHEYSGMGCLKKF